MENNDQFSHFEEFISPILVFDKKGILQHFNRSSASIFGTRPQGDEKSLILEFHPDTKLENMESLSNSIRGDSNTALLKLKVSSGRYRWFELQLLTKSNEKYVFHLSDVTKYKDTERISQYAVDMNNIFYWQIDVRTMEFKWGMNEITKLLHLAPTSLDQFVELFENNQKDLVQKIFSNCFKENCKIDETVLMETKDGLRWCRILAEPISDGRDLVYIKGSLTDVNELLCLKTELVEARNYFDNLMTTLERECLISTTDPSGKIINVNSIFCETSGYSKEELIGANHSIVNSGFHDEAFWDKFWRTISSGKSWHGEICNTAKDGRVYWVNTIISPIYDIDGNIKEFLSIRWDITDKIAQEGLLFQKERLAILGESLAQVIHDVMNPLAIIQGSVDQLESLNFADEKSSKRAEKNVGMVFKSVNRIHSIFKEMRSLLHDSPIDRAKNLLLIDVISNSSFYVKDILSKNKIELQIDVEEGLSIVGSKAQNMQIFVNLLKNAAEAVKELDEKWIRVKAFSSENHGARVLVTDSGHGIPEKIQKNIFKTLFTTKSKSGGTGLGLSSVKKLVIGHHGDIKVNNDSENTEFIIQYPKVKTDEAA
ncbi:MAG: PAS domain S-box protein [Bdellovibrionales bacterium]